MAVVPLTLTISLCLVFTFVIFFLLEHSGRRFSGVEGESLLPLAEETPRVAHDLGAHQHPHGPADGCGCHDGTRAPCVGCLKTRVVAPTASAHARF